MVNKYRRKTAQAAWDETAMTSALKEVTDLKRSVKSTAQKFGIPLTTLHRHLKSGSAQKKLGRFVTIFTSEQENELLEYLFHMDALFYGLSKEEFLQLVYQYAETNKISHPFKNNTAGRDWFKGFVKRHPNLTLRKPEPTSIARARGFNKPQVFRFYDLLEDQINKYGIDATRLYNMDETGIQTSSNKPPRVLTKTGKRQVGLISSTERGKTTTIVCCCNAAGSFLPPFMIFARKKFVARLLDGAPPGTQGTCSDNGWINGPVFLAWLRFFVETVRPTEEKKVILVLDNHESHKYLPALDFASKNHVIFISLAPHTTHKMQPLDRCIYGPLKTHFERVIATFQKGHAGRIINQSDVAKLFGDAYTKTATAQNAISGFKACGLWPTDRYIFDETDFMPATVTEIPIEGRMAICQDQPNEVCVTGSHDNMLEDISNAVKVSHPTTSPHSEVDLDRTPSPSLLEDIIASAKKSAENTECIKITSSEANDSGTGECFAQSDCTEYISHRSSTPTNAKNSLVPDLIDTHHSPLMIRPLPTVAPNKTSRKRKTQKAEILTSTPIKNDQREKLYKKNKKKTSQEVKTIVKKNLKSKLSEERNPKSKRSFIGTNLSKASSSNVCQLPKANADGRRGKKQGPEVYCMFCIELYVDPPIEDWIQCGDCKRWAHEACTGFLGHGSYYCDECHQI